MCLEGQDAFWGQHVPGERACVRRRDSRCLGDSMHSGGSMHWGGDSMHSGDSKRSGAQHTPDTQPPSTVCCGCSSVQGPPQPRQPLLPVIQPQTTGWDS